MLKKNITYVDFDGNEVTEEHCFHLSKAELIELELSNKGGFQAHLQSIVDTDDGAQIVAAFKKLVLDAYGKKSADGKRFVKSQDIRDEFASSEAYSQLFMELATDAGVAAEFVNGIMPRGLEADVARLTKTSETPEPAKTLTTDEAAGLLAEGKLQEKLDDGYILASE